MLITFFMNQFRIFFTVVSKHLKIRINRFEIQQFDVNADAVDIKFVVSATTKGYWWPLLPWAIFITAFDIDIDIDDFCSHEQYLSQVLPNDPEYDLNW